MATELVRLIRIACIVGVAAANLTARAPLAAEVSRLSISQSGDTYTVSLDAVVNAPAQPVYKLLADYGHLDRLSPVITNVTVQPTPDGQGERVRSVLKHCILFVCREIIQVEDVTEPDAYTIVGNMVPGESDFKRGRCVWRIINEGSRTRLHYEATRTAAFWVPPLIGPWAIKHAMREHLVSSMAALERLLNHHTEPGP